MKWVKNELGKTHSTCKILPKNITDSVVKLNILKRRDKEQTKVLLGISRFNSYECLSKAVVVEVIKNEN